MTKNHRNTEPMRLHDLCYMTSATYTEPTFTTASVTGYNEFQDFYNQDETFVASFKDGSNNYMTAICSLNGSNQVVADQVLMSSVGSRDLTVPTFSGTVDIVIGATTHNSYQRRFANCSSSDTSHDHHKHLNNFLIYGSQNTALTQDQLYIWPHGVDTPGWYYGFFTSEKTATAADYRLCLYDVNEAGHPDKKLMSSAVITHSTADEVESTLDNTLTITDISIASVGVVTYTGTDPANGDRIYITGVTGSVGTDVVNETSFLVSNVDTGANTFELHDLTNTDVATTGKAYTSGGTVHFPVFLSAGDYISGFVCDTNQLNFNGAVASDELARPSSFGMRTGITTVTQLNKAFTYAALPDTPDMSTGWTDSASSIIGIALLMVEG